MKFIDSDLIEHFQSQVKQDMHSKEDIIYLLRGKYMIIFDTISNTENIKFFVCKYTNDGYLILYNIMTYDYFY